MIRKPVSVLCLAVAAAFAGTALAQTSTSSTGSTTTTTPTTPTVTTTGTTTPTAPSTTTTTTGTTTSTTGGTTGPTTAASAVKPLEFTNRCPGGGTRAATGSWDSVGGTLNMSVKVTNCKWDNDELHSGTRTVNGTLTVGTLRDIKIDLTIKEDFTVTRDGASKLTHVCTLTKKGTLDDVGDRFTGTITRNCTNSGEVWDPDHWIENLMRHTLVIEVPKQSQGKTPSPRGPGNACGKLKTNPGHGSAKDKDSGGTGTTGTTTGTTGTSTTTTGMAEVHEEGDICGDD